MSQLDCMGPGTSHRGKRRLLGSLEKEKQESTPGGERGGKDTDLLWKESGSWESKGWRKKGCAQQRERAI